MAGELEGVPVATLVPHLYPVGAPGFPPYALGAKLPRSDAGSAVLAAARRTARAGPASGPRGAERDPPAARAAAARAAARRHQRRSCCLVAAFPQLEYPRPWPDHVHVVGPVLWEPPCDDVELPRGSGPLVVVAQSTAQDPRQRLLRAALSGLADSGVRVLAATDRRPLSRPVRAGSGASLVNWLSYARTMPTRVAGDHACRPRDDGARSAVGSAHPRRSAQRRYGRERRPG